MTRYNRNQGLSIGKRLVYPDILLLSDKNRPRSVKNVLKRSIMIPFRLEAEFPLDSLGPSLLTWSEGISCDGPYIHL